MAITLNKTLFPQRYRDDFADSDGYYRILFNSGRALQARELTQLQTIIQNQIKRFGDNIFKEGGVVKPGASVLNNAYEYIKLNVTTYNLPSTYNSLIGTTFTGNTSGVQAKVLEVIPSDGVDPSTLYVQYLNGPAAVAGATTVRMSPTETMTNGTVTLEVQTTDTPANPATGRGIRLSIDTGVYYAQGFFVYTEKQSLLISKYSDSINEVVGYKITEQTINVDDDGGLYDNQGLLPNISAPGADRYRITLELAKQSEITSTDNFIPVVTIKNGVAFKVVDTNSSYNKINDLIAQRIHENSGNYIVNPFKISFNEDSDATHLQMRVSDGVAVMDGYRVSRNVPVTQRIIKPITDFEFNNQKISATYGNYVEVDASTPSNMTRMPNINSFETLNIRTSTGYGGSTIGTCKLRAVSEDAGNLYRFYIFDIQMNAGRSFREAVSIGTSATVYFNVYRPLSVAELKDVTKNTLLFPIPKNRPKSISDIDLTVQRKFTITSSGSGTSSISVSATGETFDNVNDWVFADSTGFLSSVSTSGAGTNGATFSGLPISSATNGIDVLAYVNKSQGTVRTKTAQEDTATITPAADGSLDLGYADAYEIIRVRDQDSDGVNLKNNYVFDNGQRDNFYDRSKLLLKTGSAAPASGQVFVRFKYFEHGAGTNGDFFAVNSYSGQIDYKNIPAYRTASGINYNLREVLDFRSVKDGSGNFANAVTGARVHELPQVNDLISSDITAYQRRRNILTIDRDGVLSLGNGRSGDSPPAPDTPAGTLPIYDILFGGNTLDENDLKVIKVEHKRYTMKDIGRIEDRIDKLEDLTALSLLEIDTKNFKVLDSAGNDRTKSGFFVDNFTTQLYSDVRQTAYRASIDPMEGYVRPTFVENNIRLIYDSDLSSNVVKKGDNIYLKHTEVVYQNQSYASQAIRVNPFDAVLYEGHVDLSPASDEWRETKVRTKKIIDGGSKLDTSQATLWNNWQWNWGGTKINDLKVGDQTNVKSTTSGNYLNKKYNKIVSEETILEVIAERVVNVALLPFARSRKIYFKSQGLRPSSKVWLFFDGIRVNDWVREETFQFCCDDPKEYGNIHDRATQHPEGATVLETDQYGAIEGSFFLPNTNNIRFRTGTNEFKILDISADDETATGSIGRTTFISTGYLDTIDQDILSTRLLTVKGKSSSQYIPPPPSNHGGGGGDGGHHTNNSNANSCPAPAGGSLGGLADAGFGGMAV